MKDYNDYSRLSTIEKKLDRLHAGDITMSLEEEAKLEREARNLACKINHEEFSIPHYPNAEYGSIFDY